jgi:hypothetical protein
VYFLPVGSFTRIHFGLPIPLFSLSAISKTFFQRYKLNLETQKVNDGETRQENDP